MLNEVPTAAVPAGVRAGHLRGRAMRLSVSLLCLLCLLGGLHAPVRADWQSGFQAIHPLVGEIWDTAAGRAVPVDTVLTRLTQTQLILLGEVHTNPDHHRLQARVIRHLAAAGRRPAVIFEALERQQQPIIEAARHTHPENAAYLANETAFAARGWPWPAYRPLLRTVLTLRLPIIGADLTRRQTRAIIDNGLAVLGGARIKALELEKQPEAAYADQLRQRIIDSHCGYAPKRLLPGMMDAQRARDAMLAAAMRGHRDGAVLIAGAGHVGKQHGAPYYLRKQVVQADIISLALVEVAADKQRPQDYTDATESNPAFDYLWFTPRASAQDPCKRFESKLQQLQTR